MPAPTKVRTATKRYAYWSQTGAETALTDAYEKATAAAAAGASASKVAELIGELLEEYRSDEHLRDTEQFIEESRLDDEGRLL